MVDLGIHRTNRANQDIRDMLVACINENDNANWQNRSFHIEISRTPYEAMFGIRQINGLGDTDISNDILHNLSETSRK